MKLKTVKEGESTFLVPDSSMPEYGEVFYHPEQALARDMSILVYKAKGVDVLDSMSAGGARAIRLAKNGIDVVANDFSEKAVELIRKNMELNEVEFEVLNRDVRKLYHERRFGAVDLDPFGSPAPFLHCALQSAVHMIGLAATDTSAFAGSYPRVSRRRYGMNMHRLSNYPEIGVRGLAGFVIREAAKLEIAARPVFAHIFRHYYRVYFELKKGAGRTDALLDEVGLYKEQGPIYLGNLWDKKLVEKMIKLSEEIEFGHKLTLKHLELIEKEVDFPQPFFEIPKITKELKIPCPPQKEILDLTKGVRTHFSPQGFRTKMSEEKIKEIIKKLSSS